MFPTLGDMERTVAALNLFTSNRLEVLAEELAGMAHVPLSSPFQPEVIIVQSRGMARWLQLELARRHGICANCRFPFPKAFSLEIFKSVVATLPDESPFDREILVWRLFKLLPQFLDQPGFEPLQNYLSGDSDSRKRFQLAGRIAFVFDQYLIFRPRLILNWEAGQDTHWQAILWRALSEEETELHPARLHRLFTAGQSRNPTLLSAGGEDRGEEAAKQTPLPERLSIFGISALPPFYMDLFARLAQRVPVNLFLLQPSQEYWGEIVSEREREKIRKRLGQSDSDLHLERGNRLLASMGQLGRDFLKIILDSGEPIPHETFVEPDTTTLLGCIQSDILHLRDRGVDATPQQTVSAEDRSVQVHSCHSPLREMEVLYDHMLDWFAKDPSLQPRDILVMSPNIDTYAPFVQAVFDSPEQESRRIPFSLADRTPRRQSRIVDTFLSVLELPQSRLGAATVLGVLEAEPVRKKFRLSESDLEGIHNWVEETRIRWGIDEAHRSKLDLPAFAQNTWRAGIHRLLLGYAMAGRDRALFQDVLPCDNVEGSNVEILGRFVEFIERLFETVTALEQPRTLGDWEILLHKLLDDFFETEDRAESERLAIRAAVRALPRNQTLAKLDEAVPLAVMTEHLNEVLGEEHFGSGYLTGGVTFCALKPMRSIPFRVICLVGMNDRDFPRHAGRLGFDLMAELPVPGDRSSREDDRYLFLETLISARDKFYISYAGQSARDNSTAPPSVVVSELMDYIAQGFHLGALPGGTQLSRRQTKQTRAQPAAEAADQKFLPLPGRLEKDILKDHVLTRHRLQAFSQAYFEGGRLFSYSEENCRAGASASKERMARAAFLDAPLVEPEAEWRAIDVASLAEFFCNPSKFFCTRRLGLRLVESKSVLEEREPFGLDGLDSYQLRQEMTALKLALKSDAATESLITASGRLPPGEPGRAHLRNLSTEVAKFLEDIMNFLPEQPLEPAQVDFQLGAFQLSGKLSRFSTAGLFHYRCSPIKAKDILRLWIEHLVWNVVQSGGGATSLLAGTDGIRHYSPPADPAELLGPLLEFYWEGLRKPLKFFPESARAFVEQQARMDSPRVKTTPLEAAAKKWRGNQRYGIDGERDDPYLALCFRNENPLDKDFAELAQAVFTPIFQLQNIGER